MLRNKQRQAVAAVSLLFLSASLFTSPAFARKDGVSGYSGRNTVICTACHAQLPPVGAPPAVIALPPTVTITGPTTVTAGSINSYVLTMTGGVPTFGTSGLNVAANGGQLIVTSTADTWLLNNEIAHKQTIFGPKQVDAAGTASWTFDWQAPTSNGSFTLFGAALSGNGDFGFYGDSAAATTLVITVSGGAAQPPTANAGGPYSGVTGTPVQFNGSGSFDGDGFVTTYSWNFGDGSTGTGATPTHTYTTPGLYTVTLTVTDNDGMTGNATSSANIGDGAPPPPIFDGAALYSTNCSGCHGQHGGGSTSTKAGRTSAQIQSAIAGVPAMQTPSLQALSTGEVQAIADFLATSGGGTPTPQPPVAVSGGPYTGVTGTPVQFNGVGSYDNDGNVVSYAWNFGDGNLGTGSTPLHTYTAAGTYTVTLTVTDNDGLTGSVTTTASIGDSTPPPPPPIDGLALYGTNCSGCHGAAPGAKAGRTAAQIQGAINTVSAMMTPTLQALTPAEVQAISNAIYVAPTPQPPTAVSGGPYTGVAGTAVQFNGSGSFDTDGTVTAYSWNFGDGATATGATPTHSYSAAGTYAVTLTVTDNDGQQGSANTTATIGTSTPPPPPPIDGLALYNTNCSGCHGAAPGAKAGRTAAQIQNAINTVGAMNTAALRALTPAEVQAISDAIAPGTTPQPPTAVAGGPYTGVINTPVQFNGSGSFDSDGFVTAYAWNFGDGSTGTGATPTHSYTAAGLYTVTLTVTDNNNQTGNAQTTVNIGGGTTPPPPVIDGLALYNTNCSGCHGAAPGAKAGRTAAQIQSAISSVSAMMTPSLQALTPAEIQAISDAIASGGGGTPTTGAELYAAYCQSCHGPEGRGGAGTQGSVRGASSSQINSAISGESQMRYLSSVLNSTQIQRISDYLNGRDSGGGGGTPMIEVGKLRYDTYCLVCHGAEGRGGSGTEGSVRGASRYQISRAISGESAMRSLSTLSSQDIQYISDYLNGRSTPLVPAPSPTDGLSLYSTYCAGCHGAAPGAKAGRSSAQIAAAIGSVSAMQTSTLQSLTTAQIDAIAVAIGGTGGGGGGGGGGTGTDGLSLYTANCAGCHGAAPGAKAGRTATQIQNAINTVSAMNTTTLRSLTTTQVQAIADAIATSGGGGGGGGGGTGTDGLSLYTTNCSSCHGAAPGTKAGRTATQIQNAINTVSAMNTTTLRSLTSAQIQAISDAIAGTPTVPTTGEGLYNAYCLACHGPEGRGGSGTSGSVRGSSSYRISRAISSESQMRFLSSQLNSSQIQLISQYLNSGSSSYGGGSYYGGGGD